MGVVHTLYYTDPACPWSWATEPALRRLAYELGDELEIEYVMSGMGHELDPAEMVIQSLEASERSGMPVDARGWLIDPPRASHPACIGVLAAAEQGDPGPYLRRLREALFLRRRKLDSADALIGEAQSVTGLDLDRLRIDLGSHALLERFGADLERARAVDPAHHSPGAGRVELPSFEFLSADGSVHGVYGFCDYETLAGAARAAGASPSQAPAPSIEEVLRRFGPMSTAEVAAVCRLPGPTAPASLWQMAAEWKIRPERAGTGELWSLA